MADGGSRFVLAMKVTQDPPELRVVTQVCERRVAAGDEHARKRFQLVVADLAEFLWPTKALLPFHPLNQRILSLTLVYVPGKGKKRFTVGIWLRFLPLRRCKSHLVTSVQDFLQGLG